MFNQEDADRRIMEIIVRSPNSELEEIVLRCEGMTWNQVFIAIDRLSRLGQLQLRRSGRVYVLSVPEQSWMHEKRLA